MVGVAAVRVVGDEGVTGRAAESGGEQNDESLDGSDVSCELLCLAFL